MNDTELVANVSDELFWDPKIVTDSIAVSANNGVVTLRGTVGSFRQRREAKKAAERIWDCCTSRRPRLPPLVGPDPGGGGTVCQGARAAGTFFPDPADCSR